MQGGGIKNEKTDIVRFHQMMFPTLKAKALQMLGGSATIDELNSSAIDIMRLPKEMRDISHQEDGTLTEVEYRLVWARTYLKQYGLIDNSSKGI